MKQALSPLFWRSMAEVQRLTRSGSRAIRASYDEPAIESSPDLRDPAFYVNPELSLLAFQQRVLEEAQDPANPLSERVKFLSILGSNLDEFFMVRVAGLLAQAEAGILELGADGMTVRSLLAAIRKEVKRLFADAQRCLSGELVPALEDAGIHLIPYADLNAS